MAVIKYNALVSELKGSIGGSTFQKCGQSLSVRSNPSHKKCFTQSGQNLRNTFLLVADYWRALTLAQKQAWAAVASTYPTYDKFGNPIVLNGYQIFMYVNMPLANADIQVVTTAHAYTPFALFGATMSDMALSAASVSPQFAGTPDNDYAFIIYFSQPYSGNLYKPYAPTIFVYRYPVIYGSGVNIYSQVLPFLQYGVIAGNQISYEIYTACMSTGTILLESKGALQIVP